MTISRNALYGLILSLCFYTSPIRIHESFHVAHVYILALLIVMLFNARKLNKIYSVDLLLLIGVAKLLIDSLGGNVDTDTMFSHFAFIMFSTALSLYYRCRHRFFLKDKALDIFIAAGIAHAVFVVLQFAAFNFFGDFSLLNVYGSLSPYGPDPLSMELGPYNPMRQTIFRPNGLNWEPSAAGFWLLFVLALALKRGEVKYYRLMLTLIVVAILSTLSFLSWVGLLLVFGTHVFLAKKRIRKVSVVLLIVILVPVVAASATYELDLFVINLMKTRLTEIGQEGTSGYVRVSAPIVLIMKNASILGSTHVGDRRYKQIGLFDSAGHNTLSGIANTYMEYAYYYGFLGCAVALAIFWKQVVKQYRRGNAQLITMTLFAPMFGGFVFNAIFFFSFLSYLVACGRFAVNREVAASSG